MKCLILLAVVGVASAATATPSVCKALCDSASTSKCALANGTTIAIGTTVTVAAGTNVSCASGGTGTSNAYQVCRNGAAIDQVCQSSSTVTAASFTTKAALTAWLTANNYVFSSPGTSCNAVCPYTCSPGLYNCSQCFTGGCTRREDDQASREDGHEETAEERETRAGTGQVYTVCATTSTVALQTACLRAAVCNGLILSTSTCTYLISGVLVNSTCPTCNSGSKKGLLGLLGLLGLIPLLLCLSLSCLLLLCLIRRKKTAAAVPFATFDPGLPPVAATYPPPVAATYPPLAPTCPVVY